METNRLKQFCVFYEILNIRKAAEVCGLSHSALFKSLKSLQEDLGVRLYVQDGRGVAITDYGKKFYPKAKEFLMHERRLFKLEDDLRPTQKIGTFEVFSTYLLGSQWKKYFGEDALELYEMLPGMLERNIVDGRIDLGITYEVIPTAGLEYTTIGKVEMEAYAKKGAFQKKDILEVPFVAPASPIDGAPSGILGLDGWPEHKFPRKIMYRVDMMESGLALVRDGSAAIFIPKFVARLHNQFVAKEFQLSKLQLPEKMKPVYRRIYIIRRKSQPEGSLERKVAKLIRNECLCG